MSRRVYEVAKDFGWQGPDLAAKINALSLGFSVNNHMSPISEAQEDELRRALDREARENMVEERISATVIRRKRNQREKAAPEPAKAPVTASSMLARPPVGSPEPTAPSTTAEARPRRVVGTTPGLATRPGVPVEPDRDRDRGRAPERSERPERVEVTPQPRAEVTTPPVAQRDRAEFSEAVPSARPEAAEPRTVATPVIEEERASVAPPQRQVEPEYREPEPAYREPEPAYREPEPEPVREPEPAPEPETGVRRPARADIVAALARKEEAEARARTGSGAQVVGTLSPELLQARLAADRKSFGPAPKPVPGATGTRENFEAEQAGRRKRKRGKKVYGANELYDKRSATRRRTQKKGVGGQTTQITEAAEHKRVIKMEEAILVSDLAHQMGVKAGQIALKLMMELGVKGANINTPLDFDTATLLAETFGYSVEQVGFDLQKYLPKFEDVEEDYVIRAPVVTVMGHVDHGKTSLLDAIRSTDVASGEEGGITQHIGAYKVALETGAVVFLDTPGHEAFTALRARGAQATDIVILVVAADDGVMPQTVEAIAHAKDADVPIIVAVNKIDKPGANPDRVMQALTEYGLVPEAWGGETIFQQVSALNGTGVKDLVEQVLLVAEVEQYRANPKRPAEGMVIESRLDIGRGPVATVLVQEGTLRPGDVVVTASHWGRIRALTDERGRTLKEAGPATPVEITGLDGVPDAGETLYVVEDDRAARTISDHIGEQKRQKELARSAAAPTDLEALTELLGAGQLKELKVIIKSDVQGSQEALVQALTKLSTSEVKVRIVHGAVGGVTENDVNLAASSQGGAIIIGFNVRPESRAMQMAENMGISILTFGVIYDAVDAVRKLMTGMLEPVYEEAALGRAEVRDVFSIPRVGTIAGCYVTDGKVVRGGLVRLLRDNRVIYQSSISSLRRFKDDVKEVRSGFECGLSVENYNDIKVGDVIEAYEMNEVAPVLS
jgi:translation initiation factor IF-2